MGTKIKVLLTQPVEKLGAAGDIKEVSGGFGRNFLIPQGMAVLATRGEVKQAEARLTAQRKRDDATRTDAQALARRIGALTLRFVERVGEGDRLFGSVTTMDITERLTKELGTEIDRRKVLLDEPLKRTGIFPVIVRLMSGVDATVQVIVEGEAGAVQVPVIGAATEDVTGDEAA